MKNFFIFILFSICFIACKNSNSGDEAKIGEAKQEAIHKGTKFTVDSSISKIAWKGSKLGGSHSGSLDISSGEVFVINKNITGGKFQIDMNSILNFDLPNDKKGDLVKHLLSPDFFDATQFPNSKFVITKISKKINDPDISHLVYGNLTIKDHTKEIGFPAKITIVNGLVQVTSPNFTIDRTDFGVEYGSKKIFTDILKDKVINDEVTLSVNLVAKS